MIWLWGWSSLSEQPGATEVSKESLLHGGAMGITTREAANAVIFDLEGALKMGKGEQEFRDTLQEKLDAGAKNLAVNLTGVTEVDSSGISALVRAHTSAKRQGGRCRYYGANKRVIQVIKMVRLDTVFEMVEDEAAALAGL